MSFLRAVRRTVREAAAPTIFLGLTAYFGWNATQGDLGLKSYNRELAVMDRAVAARTEATQERLAWSQRVLGLRDAALDADIIDERSRAMLNLAQPDEIVVPYSADQKLF